MEMIPEDLITKYKYGYVHSCKLLEEPFIKDLLKENQELKKQLEERTKMYQNAYNYSQKMESKAVILETQQKEFIKYLEDKIERKRLNATCTTEYNDYVIPLRIVLQKYKEIIGVSDENN